MIQYIVLLAMSAHAKFPILAPSEKESGLVHKVVSGGQTIGKPKNCIEEQIKKHTIIIEGPAGRICSGVILDSNTVAFSSHCTKVASLSKELKIVTGADLMGDSIIKYFDPKTQKYQKAPKISTATSHFEGNAQLGTITEGKTDLVVAKFAEAIPGMTELTRIEFEEIGNLPGVKTIVAGFGLNETNVIPKNLKYFEGKTVRTGNSGLTLLTKGNNSGDGVKQGDSGGPVLVADFKECKIKLAGISMTVSNELGSYAQSADQIGAHLILLDLAKDEIIAPVPKPASRPARK